MQEYVKSSLKILIVSNTVVLNVYNVLIDIMYQNKQENVKMLLLYVKTITQKASVPVVIEATDYTKELAS